MIGLNICITYWLAYVAANIINLFRFDFKSMFFENIMLGAVMLFANALFKHLLRRKK